jgi:glucose-1-phosphate thymidylyltransferase
MRPHTHTKVKHLLHVAGKTMLDHLLDSFKQLKIDEYIFILAPHDHQTEEHVKKHYHFKASYAVQKEALGNAHAIYQAKDLVKGDEIMVVFGDTLFVTDLGLVKKTKSDCIIWTRKVEDPRRFGVVFEEKGFITKIIEKPDKPVSNKAITGLYYFRNSQDLMDSIKYIMDKGIKTKGEFYLTDAMQHMIDQGRKFVNADMKAWLDCGKPETVLSTNQYLLEHGCHHVIPTKNTVIKRPVFIEKGASVENSIIGPFVSIAKDANIKNAIIENSIINKEAIVEDVQLKDSIVGEAAVVKDFFKKLNVGDNSEIVYDGK